LNIPAVLVHGTLAILNFISTTHYSMDLSFDCQFVIILQVI
jgi:hypothetical protein